MKHLFLDLEDTIIKPITTSWFNTDIINKHKVVDFIEQHKFDTINIYSFAIWNQQELLKFNRDLKTFLENELNLKFNQILTVDDDIIPICCQFMKINKNTVDFDDMSTFWSKDLSFQLFCRSQFANKEQKQEVFLLDDIVETCHIDFTNLNLSVTIKNILDI